MPIPPSKRVFWLYGLSGSGKSTLASQVVRRLQEDGCPALILDGDALRLGLCRDLSYGPEGRVENVRRTAEISRLLSGQGHVVLCALMTPLESMRQLARSIVGEDSFHEVYVSCDYATCAQRDPKGLYARAEAGEMRHFPGRDMVFEEPLRPDLVVETARMPVEDCVESLLGEIRQKAFPCMEGRPSREKLFFPAGGFLRPAGLARAC